MGKLEHKVMHYPAVFSPSSDGGYDVSFPDFPGCVTFGASLPDAKQKAREVLELWLEELREQNEDIPLNRSQKPIIEDIDVTLPGV